MYRSSCIGGRGTAILMFLVLTLVFTLVTGFFSLPSKAEEAVTFNANGDLIQPKNFEWRKWVFVGTPVTPNSLNPPKAAFPEFHNVYIDSESFEHYSKTGQFREGTVLIKELVSVGATQAASGKGYFEGDFIGLEAAIKDSKRFKDEPGYWAYFTFSHEPLPYPETAKKNPVTDCNVCHQDNAADDWVFTQYYPVLRAVKPRK
jgi:hypothetical protein